MKNTIFALIIAFFSVFNLVAQESPSTQASKAEAKTTEKTIPKSLSEAIEALDIIVAQSLREKIQKNEVHAVDLHFSLGMGLRNQWGLWRGSALAKYFNELGVMEPDAMSGIIIETYVRKLRNQPLKVEEQIEEHKAYWNSESQKRIRRAREKAEKEGA